jgi:hypothetical protein
MKGAEMDVTHCTLRKHENARKVLVGKLEVMRPLGRHRRRWTDNIKIGIKHALIMWTRFVWLRIWSSNELL